MAELMSGVFVTPKQLIALESESGTGHQIFNGLFLFEERTAKYDTERYS